MSSNVRTNIVINQDLMNEALELSGLGSRRELENRGQKAGSKAGSKTGVKSFIVHS